MQCETNRPPFLPCHPLWASRSLAYTACLGEPVTAIPSAIRTAVAILHLDLFGDSQGSRAHRRDDSEGEGLGVGDGGSLP